jgi:hypothetical protein
MPKMGSDHSSRKVSVQIRMTPNSKAGTKGGADRSAS